MNPTLIELAFKAIDDVSELPDEMPDYVYNLFKNSINEREVTAEFLRVLVRTAKNEAKENLVKYLHDPPKA